MCSRPGHAASYIPAAPNRLLPLTHVRNARWRRQAVGVDSVKPRDPAPVSPPARRRAASYPKPHFGTTNYYVEKYIDPDLRSTIGRTLLINDRLTRFVGRWLAGALLAAHWLRPVVVMSEETLNGEARVAGEMTQAASGRRKTVGCEAGGRRWAARRAADGGLRGGRLLTSTRVRFKSLIMILRSNTRSGTCVMAVLGRTGPRSGLYRVECP